MARKKKLITADQLMALGDKENAEEARHREATYQGTSRREEFEQAHADRFHGVGDMPVGRESGRTVSEAGISPKLAYHLMGFHAQEPETPHPHGQMEFPGLEHRRAAVDTGMLSRDYPTHTASGRPMPQALPDLAPAPPRWEHMAEGAQARTLRAAREYGVTPETMHRSFGAQLDQGHIRAQQHGMTPYATHFYSGDDPSRVSTPDEMQPRDRLIQSAHENDVPFSTQVVANAKTSPRAKFRQTSTSGVVHYPNDEAANVAIHGVQAGIAPSKITKPEGLQVTNTNIRLAANVVQQHLGGRLVDELRNPPSKQKPEGSDPFGPKTGPYANSFMDPHGSTQFFVSDVHSGGAGMAPHIPHESPFKRHPETGEILYNEQGNPTRDASERENYLAIPGIHALHDHVARQVMAERGLQSLSGVQATQWGEEQVSRAEVDRGARKVTLVSEAEAYPRHVAQQEVHGQTSLFGGDTTEHISGGPMRKPANTVEMPEGRERVAAEAKAAAIHRNVARKRGIPTYKELGNEPYEGWG